MKCLCSLKKGCLVLLITQPFIQKRLFQMESESKTRQKKELLVSFTLFLNDIGENGKANYGSSKIQS